MLPTGDIGWRKVTYTPLADLVSQVNYFCGWQCIGKYADLAVEAGSSDHNVEIWAKRVRESRS
jgi:hypothetical protein